MTPKRGQPPKPQEDRKSGQIGLRTTTSERQILEEAYRLSETTKTFSRWMIRITLKEAKKIIEAHKNGK